MIGEVDYEIIVGVIHNMLAVMFFYRGFYVCFSFEHAHEKRTLLPSFHEHAVYDGEL